MAEAPETRYAQATDGGYIAYQVIGDGPIDVLVSRSTGFPVDLMWDEPRLAFFLNRLSSFCRHIWFDARGTGASDWIPHQEGRLLESLIDDMVAVLDAADSQQAAVVSMAGLPTGLLFAATHPERTSALVLVNVSVRYRPAEDYPQGGPDAEIDANLERFLGHTNEGILLWAAPSLADDARFRRWAGRA